MWTIWETQSNLLSVQPPIHKHISTSSNSPPSTLTQCSATLHFTANNMTWVRRNTTSNISSKNWLHRRQTAPYNLTISNIASSGCKYTAVAMEYVLISLSVTMVYYPYSNWTLSIVWPKCNILRHRPLVCPQLNEEGMGTCLMSLDRHQVLVQVLLLGIRALQLGPNKNPPPPGHSLHSEKKKNASRGDEATR